MTHKYYLLLPLLALYTHLNAQSVSHSCATDFFSVQTLANPAQLTEHQLYESAVYQHFIAKKQPGNADFSGDIRTIPVVVHLVHDFGLENLPDAQIVQAIAWLNDALGNSGSFAQGSGADTKIRLCLAQRSPNNQPTNGITRTASQLTNLQYNLDDAALKNLIRWNPKDYLNIWVVREICHSNGDCGVGGYTAQWASHGAPEDGIVIEARNWGADNAFTPIVAHEIGHYFSLYHTFYQTCSNNDCQLDGDRICDTPPDQSTSSAPCGVLVNSCSNDVSSGPFTTDQPDMTWNFMDYGHFACMHDFTAEQAERMNFNLSEKRKQLLSSDGCKEPCMFQPVANIEANTYQPVAGQMVFLGHTGSNGLSYEWSVGGVVFATTAQASFIFSSAGDYIVQFVINPFNEAVCDPDTAYLNISVRCPLQPNFTVSDQELQLNETVYIQNQSPGGVIQNWYLNGELIGSTLESLSFTEAGVYVLKLEISDGICSQSIEKQILVRDGCDISTWQMVCSEVFSKGNVASCMLPDSSLIMVVPNAAELFIIKMSPSGAFLWSKKLGSFGLPPDARNKIEVCALPDNGFVIVPAIIGANAPRIILRFDAAGNLLWSREVTGGESSQVLRHITTSGDGNLLFCGGGEGNGFFYGKMDLNGNLLWSQSQQGASIGIDLDALAELPSGNIIFSGNNSVHLNLIKTTAAGEILWHNTYSYGWNGIQFNLDEPDLYYLPASHQLLYYQTTGSNSVTKLDTNGMVVWVKNVTFDGFPSNPQVPHVLKPLSTGEILLAGKISQGANAMFLAKLDSNLEIIWSRFYNAYPNSISSIQENPFGGFFILGTIKLDGFNDNIWIQKTDNKGFAGDCEPNIISVKTSTRSPSLINLELAPALPIQVTNANTLPADTAVLSPRKICEETCDRVLEICNNGNDDDLDGLHDCLDPDCNCENICQTKRNNRWLFGFHELDFNTNPPSLLSSTTDPGLWPSVICDENGRLLYYANTSTHISNRAKFKMSSPHPDNGGILGHHPGSKTEYYCFSGQNPGLVAFTIDGSLNLTLGAVRNEVITLDSNWPPGAGQLTTINACESGYWLAGHEPNNNIFKLWHVGVNGINTTPVVNAIGPVINTVPRLKFSPDGRHLALFSSISGVHLFDFDPSTGIISNARPLSLPTPLPLFEWSLEFSPNGRFLYVNVVSLTVQNEKISTLYQFDLETPELFRTSIKTEDFVYADMQTGPDGQIYLLTNGVNSFLGAIRRPNQPGLACDYVAPLIYLSASNNYLPHSNPSDYYQPHVSFDYNAPDTICSFAGIDFLYQLRMPQCFFDSIIWKLEGLAGTVNSMGETAIVRFNEAGYGKLIATGVAACGNASDTLDIYIPGPNLNTLTLGPDIAICQNGVTILDAGAGFSRYRWSTGAIDPFIETTGPGQYWVDVWDECGNLQTDTILVSIDPGAVLNLAPGLLQRCVDFSETFELPAFFNQWQWLPDEHLNCTDCQSVTVSPGMDFSWIITAQNDQGCIGVDTLTIQIIDTLYNLLDTFVCAGEQLKVHGLSLPADTTVTLFMPASGIGCDTMLTIQVLGVDLNTTSLVVSVCSNEIIDFAGVWLPPDTTAVFPFQNQFGCDSVVTIQTVSYPPISADLPSDTTLKIGAVMTLSPTVLGTAPLQYTWIPENGLSCSDCSAPLVALSDTQTYLLIVMDANGCQSSDTITIAIDPTCSIEVPNAFTPNDDGANDFLRPITDPCVTEIALFKVVNRWGKTVFEQINMSPNDAQGGWDGMVAGRPQPSDVYIWKAVYRLSDGSQLTKTGESSLLR